MFNIKKKLTFLKLFWTQHDLAWITAIFCFKKYDTFLRFFFLQNPELWPTGVSATCSHRTRWHWGGSESIIWSTPSSNGLVIGPLLASGDRKKLFFSSGVGGWNNHLQMGFCQNIPTRFWASFFSKSQLFSKASRNFSIHEHVQGIWNFRLI